jgi:hypothetical protein
MLRWAAVRNVFALAPVPWLWEADPGPCEFEHQETCLYHPAESVSSQSHFRHRFVPIINTMPAAHRWMLLSNPEHPGENPHNPISGASWQANPPQHLCINYVDITAQLRKSS